MRKPIPSLGGMRRIIMMASGARRKRPMRLGRPVDVAVARDGSLLVTDDGGDAIWRVTYKGE